MTEHTKEDAIRDTMVEVGETALDIIRNYLSSDIKGGKKVEHAFKMLGVTTKVLHMNQIRTFTERSQALRLMKFLPNDETREEYIKLTNPVAAPLLKARPRKRLKAKS